MLTACASATTADSTAISLDVANVAVAEVFAESQNAEIMPLAAVSESSNQSQSTTIELQGNSAQISGNGAAFSSGILTINTAGTYFLTGELTGQILVDAADEVVQLILDGVNIRNENGPAIFAPRAAQLEITLLGENTVSDGANHPDDNANAAIYIQPNLRIDGNGQLTVRSDFRHGLRSQGVLTVYGGVFDIETTDGNALQGRDGVIIHDGEFRLVGGGEGDGIRASRENDPARGFITINGGDFAITAGDDGLQAESTIEINGGNFAISAVDDGMTTKGAVLITGGNINILDSYEGIEGLTVTITGGNFNISATDDAINARLHEDIQDAFLADLPSRNAMYDHIYIRISGGVFDILAGGDALDSNGDLFIEGGNFNISAVSSPRESAVDFVRNFHLTGGEMIISGGVEGFPQSNQPFVFLNLGRQFATNSAVEVRNSAGEILATHTARMGFSMFAYTSARLEFGQTYSLYINGEQIRSFVAGESDAIGGRGGFAPQRQQTPQTRTPQQPHGRTRN